MTRARCRRDIVTKMEYYPYGEHWEVASDDNHAPKYNSQELDQETQFYSYNARNYDPIISRFITADPIIDDEYDTQGWNRYSYVKGNPIRYNDPSGNFLEWLFKYLFGEATESAVEKTTPLDEDESSVVVSGTMGAVEGALEGARICGGNPYCIAGMAVLGGASGVSEDYLVDKAKEKATEVYYETVSPILNEAEEHVDCIYEEEDCF